MTECYCHSPTCPTSKAVEALKTNEGHFIMYSIWQNVLYAEAKNNNNNKTGDYKKAWAGL